MSLRGRYSPARSNLPLTEDCFAPRFAQARNDIELNRTCAAMRQRRFLIKGAPSLPIVYLFQFEEGNQLRAIKGFHGDTVTLANNGTATRCLPIEDELTGSRVVAQGRTTRVRRK